jgi:hypothetical protein
MMADVVALSVRGFAAEQMSDKGSALRWGVLEMLAVGNHKGLEV